MTNINSMTDEPSNGKKKFVVFKDYDIFKGKIRLINENGESSIVERDYAIELAKSSNMNLIQVAYSKDSYPKSTCKIMNYGKMQYEQKKREKENARKSRIANADAKEIVFSIRIDDGDYTHKINQIKNFLNEKLKVKITIKLSKREAESVRYMAKDLIKKILNCFNDFAILDGEPSDTGRIISCMIKPIKK